MNTKAEIQLSKTHSTNNLDSLKWIVSTALLCVGFFAYYHYGQYPVIYRVLALLPVVAIALFVAVLTQKGAAFWSLMRDAFIEVRRVVWPTPQETTQTTLVVLLVVAAMGLLLWLLDMTLSWLVSLAMG